MLGRGEPNGGTLAGTETTGRASPERESLQFEPLSAKHRFVLTLAGIGALGLGLMRLSAAQQPPGTGLSEHSRVLYASQDICVVDVTPTGQTEPLVHVVYNFNKNTVAKVSIDRDGARVHSVQPLDRVSPPDR